MPSKTFINLDSDKKEKLISSAMNEFSNHLYPDVSINKIISNAKISRGSFYTYFNDKDDLFLYLIELNHLKLNDIVKKQLIINSGDLHNSFINLYDEFITNVFNKSYEGFFKNIFIFFNTCFEKEENPRHILFEYVKNDICIDNIKSKDEIDLIFGVFMHNLFVAIVDTIKSNNIEKTKCQYLKKLDIICYGIYKEVLDV